MLSPAELEAMRQTLALSLPDHCTRQVRTTAPDGYGGVIETWTSATLIPCRLLSRTARVVSVAGQAGQVAETLAWSLVYRHDQALSAGDRVVLQGQTWEVVATADYPSERLCRRAELRRVT